MRRSRLAELKRARPIAWQNGLRRAAFGGDCWRMSAAGRAWQQHLQRLLGDQQQEDAAQ